MTGDPATFSDQELMELLASVDRINPQLMKGYVAVVLKHMPRPEYLQFITQVERMRP